MNFMVLPIFDQALNYRRIDERRSFAKRAKLVLGDLAQDPAHNLSRAGFGQTRRKLDDPDLTNFSPYHATSSLSNSL